MLTWQRYAEMSDAELGQHDLAVVNLACAAGLPDAGKIDVPGCLDRLDYCARRVRLETEPGLRHFRRHRHDFKNSEGYFRLLALASVLRRVCAVRYNPAKIDEEVPLDTADIYIHGALLGNGGTCASLPVVYAAVGRRLGYPLKLVAAKTHRWGHLFVRWEDETGSFNLETTAVGLVSDPDEYYRTGVYRISPEVERRCALLRSMTPREELAGFLIERGIRWLDFGRYRRAAEGAAWAVGLAPANEAYARKLGELLDRWRDELRQRCPPGFPRMQLSSIRRRFPDGVPLAMEVDFLGLMATENLLGNAEHEREWWGPMREGCSPQAPVQALVDFRGLECNVRFQFAAPQAAYSFDCHR